MKMLKKSVLTFNSKAMYKTLLFAILCAFGLCTFGTQTMSPNMSLLINMRCDNPEINKIELQGLLMYNVGPNAIEAYVADDAVYVQFNQSFGNVSISLYNSINGLIYSDIVNTDVQQLVIIPIGNVENGTYTLVLNNVNGSAEGDFEHNND